MTIETFCLHLYSRNNTYYVHYLVDLSMKAGIDIPVLSAFISVLFIEQR